MSIYIQNPLGTQMTTIAGGQSLSDAVDLGGLRLFGLMMPAAWTEAVIGFQVSFDGGVNWRALYDGQGGEVTVKPVANGFVALDPVNFASVPMVRLRSGTAVAAVNQAAARAVGLVLRSI